METKQWFYSKIVWLGIIQTLVAVLQLVAEFLNKGDFQPSGLVLLVAGILTIVMRVLYTDTIIEK